MKPFGATMASKLNFYYIVYEKSIKKFCNLVKLLGVTRRLSLTFII